MPYSVEMYFDFVTDGLVRDSWKELGKFSSSVEMSGITPHLKLALFDELDAATVKKELEAYAKQTPSFEVVFPSIGIFPSPRSIIFLAPAMTPGLLDFQQRLLHKLNELGSQPWEYCLPSRWVPNCALVRDLPPHMVAPATAVCSKTQLPVFGRLEKIALIEFPPVKEHCVFDLQGS